MAGRILELVSKIHLDWKRHVARGLAPHGVNPKQVFVLRKLAESDGLMPSDIAVLIHGDRPSVTSMLDTLEREGWIARHRDPSNRKRVIVSLTAAGRSKLASVPQRLWRSGKMPFDPEACLNTAERAQLVRLLERLHQSIVAESAEG
jgi:DNA-binding MarR family transcriptional regulator